MSQSVDTGNEESTFSDEERAALERIAASEVPAAWVARALLEHDE